MNAAKIPYLTLDPEIEAGDGDIDSIFNQQ